jgi:hypothetical protein
VEQHIKQEAHKWLMVEHGELADRVMLSSVGVEFGLAELFENVEF